MPDDATPDLSWREYWMDIATPIEGVLPILEGALHFGPSYLCRSEGGMVGEPLTEHGRRFVAFLHPIVVEANTAAHRARGELSPDGPAYAAAEKACERLVPCVLISTALLSQEYPAEVSTHDALDEILKGLRAAHEVIGRDPYIRAEEASHA